MRTRVAGDLVVLALAQAILVLRVKRRPAADALEDFAHAVIVLDQQRTGG
jgi:hypothetical protein